MCKNANEIHDRIEHIFQEENYIQKDLSPYFAHSKQELLKAYNTRLIGIWILLGSPIYHACFAINTLYINW